MRPYHGTRVSGVPGGPRQERVKRFHHVGVAQVPRFDLACEHRAVVQLGVAHEAGILFREEIFVFRDASVPIRVIGRGSPQLHQLRDDVVFARGGEAERCCVAVALRVGSEFLEAAVPPARPRRAFGIDLAEILQDCVD